MASDAIFSAGFDIYIISSITSAWPS